MGDAKIFTGPSGGDPPTQNDSGAEADALEADTLEADTLEADGELAPVRRAHPWRARAVLALRVAAALAIMYFIVVTTIEQWDDVRATFADLSWLALGLSLIAGVASLWTHALAWRAIVNHLSHPLPVRTAAPILLVGQLGKYLPGSVWAYVVQMELGRRAGVLRSKVFIASLVVTGVSVTVGLLITAPGLGVAFRAADRADHRTFALIAVWSAVILLPVAVVCCHPTVLTRLIGVTLRVMRRPGLDRPITWRVVLASSLWVAVGYVLGGMHLWLLVQSRAMSGPSGIPGNVWAISMALSVSAFVIIAPSGIGVREFLIAVALTGFGVPYPIGWGLALASRLIYTIADIVAAGASAVVGLRRIRHSAEEQHSHG